MPKKKTFKQLQKEWYAKLRDSGFQDIEATHSGTQSQYLKTPPRPDPLTYESTRAYYDMAERFLQNRNLRGADRFIWTHHAAGKTYDEILVLYNAKYKPTSVWSLFYRTQELLEQCKAWNKRSPHGCLYTPKDESEAE